MLDLNELQRLAEEGQWMPAYTAKKLIAAALAAIGVIEDDPETDIVLMYERRRRRLDALRTALEALKGKT